MLYINFVFSIFHLNTVLSVIIVDNNMAFKIYNLSGFERIRAQELARLGTECCCFHGRILRGWQTMGSLITEENKRDSWD